MNVKFIEYTLFNEKLYSSSYKIDFVSFNEIDDCGRIMHAALFDKKSVLAHGRERELL